MSRYIDADALNDSIVEKWGIDPKYLDDSLDAMKDVQTLEWINSAPSIEIVRCAECKFSESVITSWSTDGKNNVVERLCKVHKWSVKDDDYCSYGEREGRE